MSGQILVVDDSATVRKIVRLVLEGAGYGVTDAADGQQALDLVQRDGFDLALIDFVMPKLNGYQLTQAIRSIPHLRTLPIVLMSAKAEQIGERFMRQTGAIDAITKPFPPDAILAVVSHAVTSKREQSNPTLVRDEMRGSSLVPPPPSPSQVPEFTDSDAFAPYEFGAGTVADAPAFRDAAMRAASDSSDLEGTQSKQTSRDVSGLVPRVAAQAAAAERVAELVARAIHPLIDRAVAERASPTERALAEALAQIVPPHELASIARDLRAFDTELRGPIAFEGVVSMAPLGEVLQMLRLQRQTGTLVVQRKVSEVAIAFNLGNIDVAVARGVSSEFLLGRYLIADDKLTREQLEEFLRAGDESGGWLGERLIRSGHITREDLDRALMRQTSEIIYEMLRWPDGTFRFEFGVVLPEAKSAALELPIESIVLEGFRRVDEWRLIEQEIVSFENVLARDESAVEAVGVERLARDEIAVLEIIDGVRSVRDVVLASKMSSFDACRIMYRLLRSKLVRRRAA